ncbi:MAG: AAA family ATPase [Oscillatoria sp. PMC 1068.18]|nr:AAA family ATPase [Oscillatoria sp. PMC 1076.18]MEC4989106.1 AAA family ATPase [Oscillatoria sp. PMC 1068.18]
MNTQQASLIEQMQQPEFYPHPVTTPIKLFQTHVSYVLLTGDFAYKVKKAVNFGFLDYSSVGKRKHFCAEEIRLNQPNATEIYLEVLPITQKDEKFVLNGAGEPVEYALKMRQFPQTALMSEMYQEGKLTTELMADLGRVVAEFHRQTPTNDYIRSFGEIEQISAAFNENYEQTDKYIGKPQTQQQFAETKEFSDTFFAERTDLFAQRREEDKIRECHGDLHLRNICFWNDKICLFDRIEFNEPFRFVDVMYDIAFAVMDLDARGNKDFGNAFLNAYIEETGDWEGLRVLPLYLSRQAYVRGKVISFLLDDPGVPETDKQEAAKTAADYYRLAWDYTKTGQGKLILMSGLSGSGKTTVARELARKLGAIHLRSDAVRKHLAGISLSEKGGDELYTTEMSQKTYDRLLELGLMLASEGFPVILDAKYDRVATREKCLSAAKKASLPVQILHCTAPIEVLRTRLESRENDISDATAGILASQEAAAEAFTDDEAAYVTTIDTTGDWGFVIGDL